jgi:type I restriction enzyme M protein
MSATASSLVQKVWNYAHVLKDDGLAFMDYTEQITFLLFLRMAYEREQIGSESAISEQFSWSALSSKSGDALEVQYSKTLRELGKLPGLLGVIFAKAQNKITDPAKLERLISMIEGENWSGMDVDVKGEIYEGLLARNAEDVRGGAGQYFTPRPIIRAIVQVMRPEPSMRITDPACGTGGFLLAAYEYLVKNNPDLDRRTQRFLNEEAIRGNDIVPNVTRLCAMNLYLHGMGGEKPLVTTSDSLANRPDPVDMVLTNPPFGKKSSITVINDGGKAEKEKIFYERLDFWATTSNKQLNFLQHVYSMLKDIGRAAVVVPDNVLFEAGAGEKIRRALLERCDVHTLLRLPTGIWYSPGVKANVIFFDKKPAAKTPWTKELWVYDLRTNISFTLRQNPISDVDLKDFVECCQPGKPVAKRKESERFKSFTYDNLMARDKANLDISWLKDDSLADTENLPAPAVLAAEIIEDLQEALEEFRAVEEELNNKS